MRRGFTLIELMLGIAITGMLMLIAVPRVMAVIDAAALRHESIRLVAALDVARTAAVRLGSVVSLTLSDTAYTATAAFDTANVRVWRDTGPSSNRVTLSGAGAALLFAPSGIAMGASNRTLTLSRGTTSRRIVISRLGRIT